jgi:DNA-binding NtrC family response regulator
MDLIGRSPQMMAVRAHVARVAPLLTPVVITGETGTGKDLAAAAIHRASPRAARRLGQVNVAAIPEAIFETECFGRPPGHRGWLEAAEGSSLLFAHFHAWPRALQPRLLRLVRERTYVPVGDWRMVTADVRLIVTTSVDPETFVADGTFSRALYRALSVNWIHIPPLRERVEDVPLLARYFLDRFAREYRKDITGFVPEALTMLTRHPWPGNGRELMNVIERAVIFSTNKRIVPDDVASLYAGRLSA